LPASRWRFSTRSVASRASRPMRWCPLQRDPRAVLGAVGSSSKGQKKLLLYFLALSCGWRDKAALRLQRRRHFLESRSVLAHNSNCCPSVRRISPSASSRKMLADPRMWPASARPARGRTLGHTGHRGRNGRMRRAHRRSRKADRSCLTRHDVGWIAENPLPANYELVAEA
jgi:hypothetical protein